MDKGYRIKYRKYFLEEGYSCVCFTRDALREVVGQKIRPTTAERYSCVCFTRTAERYSCVCFTRDALREVVGQKIRPTTAEKVIVVCVLREMPSARLLVRK